MALLLVVQDGVISPENRDPTFPDRAQKTLELEEPRGLQKGSPAKRPGTPYALRRNIFRKR
jgi:hypothetical protein